MADYVRQPAVLDYCQDGITIANLDSIQWQHAQAPWGTIDGVEIWDALAGGAQLGDVGALTPLAVAQYDIVRIPASGLAMTYAPSPRPFGTGTFGTFPFGTYLAFFAVTVALERAFNPTHACAPGTWAPGPFSRAA